MSKGAITAISIAANIAQAAAWAKQAAEIGRLRLENSNLQAELHRARSRGLQLEQEVRCLRDQLKAQLCSSKKE